MLGWKATHAFLRPSRSPQYWLVGRQVNCHPAAASHAVEGEVVDLGASALSRLNVIAYRRGAPAAEQSHINGVAVRPAGNLLWPILGALDKRVLHEHTWQHMDRCLACITLQLLVFVSISSIEVGWSLCPFLLFFVCQ